MIRRLLCRLGLHKWNKWKVVKFGKNFYEDELIRRCKHCDETEYYIGITEKDMFAGNYSPYTFKH